MAELEQRMFRLGETLKSLEPENSSRLMLGLKFAREELVLHQMKEIQEQLEKASLGESLVEQKQLLSKLERLEQLLLSADLDFQMRLQRLRQIREILRRLEPIIREEDREQKLSGQTAARETRAAELAQQPGSARRVDPPSNGPCRSQPRAGQRSGLGREQGRLGRTGRRARQNPGANRGAGRTPRSMFPLPMPRRPSKKAPARGTKSQSDEKPAAEDKARRRQGCNPTADEKPPAEKSPRPTKKPRPKTKPDCSRSVAGQMLAAKEQAWQRRAGQGRALDRAGAGRPCSRCPGRRRAAAGRTGGGARRPKNSPAWPKTSRPTANRPTSIDEHGPRLGRQRSGSPGRAASSRAATCRRPKET